MKYLIFITESPKGITHFQFVREYVNAFAIHLKF